MNVRFLDNAVPAEAADWLACWQAWPGREVSAHPGYVSLFARPADRVVCATMSEAGAGVLFPFLLRPLDVEPWTESGETACDLVTPYGYGGAFAWNCDAEQANTFWERFQAWAKTQHVVSSFARLSLFPDQQLPFAGEVTVDRQNIVRDLAPTPEELWKDFEHKVRKNVNRAKRSGLTVEIDESGRRIEEYLAIYYATMERREAAGGYFFPREFFEQLVHDLPGQFVFFHVLDSGQVVSTELVLVSAENMYSFLGGTLADSFAKRPNDLLKYEAMLWGRQSGKRTFVLGGGYAENDGIYRYKKSFSPIGSKPFRVARKIYDTAAYYRLLEHRRLQETNNDPAWTPKAGYFPVYRA
ncbi:MAG: GNAT family N-acetyltransferase [Pirellulales bacterium]|nr:GNAT family N-acetyltransferase [Pirellulales bacterium]